MPLSTLEQYWYFGPDNTWSWEDCGMFSNIPVLYLLIANSTHRPRLCQIKMSVDISHVTKFPICGKSPRSKPNHCLHVHTHTVACIYVKLSVTTFTGWGKNRYIVISMQNTWFSLKLLLINYCIIFHTNNYKPTFSPPCIINLTKTLGGRYCQPPWIDGKCMNWYPQLTDEWV